MNARSLDITDNGGYIITGFSDYKLRVIKTNSVGTIEWDRKLPEENNGWYSIGNAVQQTYDGDYIIGGYTDNYGAGEMDYWLIKFDKDGVEEWNVTFGSQENEYGNNVIQIDDGGYVMCGQRETGNVLNNHFWLVRTDWFGNLIWSNRYGGEQDGFSNCIQQTPDNGYISVGGTNPFQGGKCWMIKIGPDELNFPPTSPIIKGKTNCRVGWRYTYTFTSGDSDGDFLVYEVFYGDGTFVELGPLHPGEPATLVINWNNTGNYSILARTRDVNGASSYWGSLKVTVPRTKTHWIRLLDMFQILERIINIIL
jgi:hypothetical protein